MKKIFVEFIEAFHNVKQLCANDPDQVRVLYESHSGRDGMFSKLRLAMTRIEKWQADNKITNEIAHKFLDERDEFERKWKSYFVYVARTNAMNRAWEWLEDANRSQQIKCYKDFLAHKQQNTKALAQQTPLDFKAFSDEYFDPANHNPHQVYEALMHILKKIETECNPEKFLREQFEDDMNRLYEHHFGDDGVSEVESTIKAENHSASNIDDPDRNIELEHRRIQFVIEYLRYLRQNIGIDVAECFTRWNSVPSYIVPIGIDIGINEPEKGTLYELLTDAIRAYVAGAPAACVALCRAALEMTLVDHFDVESFEKDKAGNRKSNERGDFYTLPLERIIKNVQRDKRYEWIQKFDLIGLKQMADDVMHRYSRTKRLSAQEDAKIIEFLDTIRALIEGAPSRRK